jgi:hypothetical protein
VEGLFIKRNKRGLLCNYFWDGKDLIGILEKYSGYSKKGRGLSGIKFIWWEG